jgi:hypothetical protein
MIAKAIRVRFSGEKEKEVAVALINMAGDILGSDGDLSPWL